ncbi:MAG: membrane protein insertase YidC [Pseudomonadota bacterium]
MDDQNKNLILATALSFLVILAWFFVGPLLKPEWFPEVTDRQTELSSPVETADTLTPPAAAPAPTEPAAGTGTGVAADVTPGETTTVADAPRLVIETPRLGGSLSLAGGRLDDLTLKDYRTTLADNSPFVQLLSPVGSFEAYYALYGWAPGGSLDFGDVPGADTLWTPVSGDRLTPETPITLEWISPVGLIFRRVIEIDDNYMFTVTQSVENTGSEAQRLAAYGSIARHGEPSDMKGFFIIHEGAMRQTGEELEEESYSNIRDFDTDPRWGPAASVVEITENGWLGFTDHYWMTTLIPQSSQPFTSVLRYDARADVYRAETRMPTVEVAPGETASVTTSFFAGAKEWEAIRNYERDAGIYRFVDSIDWGWFYFFTKPIFRLLHELNRLIGNMGWSIIALTFLIKLVLFPLAYKSYVSMAKMKELQPEMEKIKERAGEDRQKLQQEMMDLYRKEKVNPASGCLPILLQIPIFFSLYKVIFVTIELRHAPWIGWIRDLSAPDPSSLYNLWGLLPWGTPEPGSIMALAFIGILPLLLGVSMWLQQKLNPAPTDATQAMIFAWMPWVFMFMLGSFASGLVIYWIANNAITFAQQYLIMRSQGYKPDVFGNIISGFKRSKSDEK